MDVFALASWILVLIAAVTLIWPVNIPLLALAYKVRRGPQPVDLENREFWLRCSFAALGLAVLSLVLIGLVFASTRLVQIPAGPVELILLMIYVTAAVAFLFWALALEDLLQALAVFSLYILLPGVPILLIGWVAGYWERLKQSAPWLLLSS